MPHLGEEELVAIAFAEVPPDMRAAIDAHLARCRECRTACGDLARAVALLEAQPLEPAPPGGWARLRSRLEKTRGDREWAEPAWIPLLAAHAGGAALMLAAMVFFGAWLETTALWQFVRSWPPARAAGGWGATAAVFFGLGTLGTLAMAPVLWWESRQGSAVH